MANHSVHCQRDDEAVPTGPNDAEPAHEPRDGAADHAAGQDGPRRPFQSTYAFILIGRQCKTELF